jgi:phosphoribosylformylglycinamidine cyclo-ligase
MPVEIADLHRPGVWMNYHKTGRSHAKARWTLRSGDSGRGRKELADAAKAVQDWLKKAKDQGIPIRPIGGAWSPSNIQLIEDGWMLHTRRFNRLFRLSAEDFERPDTIHPDAYMLVEGGVQGAEPLFFLDYYATGKLDNAIASAVVASVAEGCRQAGCALIGGETAEMPGMYGAGDYDLAGFCVGAVERDKVLTGAHIRPGDLILGLASSGVHSNGFSLVRRIIAQEQWNLDDRPAWGGGKGVGELLLEPTRIYVRSLLPPVQEQRIKGLAHITGGGLLENIPRVLPDSCHAIVETSRWTLPPIFTLLQEGGRVAPEEMARTFNCGVGMAVLVAPEQAANVTSAVEGAGETIFEIGRIEEGQRGCTIRGAAGTWNSPKDWSATHNA